MACIIDIDGTLLDSGAPCRGAAALVDHLGERGIAYLLMTNSIRKPAAQEERLASAGIRVAPGRVLNPIAAINEYARGRGLRKARIVGTRDEIEQVELDCVEAGNELTILLDFEKGNKAYADLQAVLEDMERGVEVLTASRSPWYLKSGRKTIDTGAFVLLLEAVSGLAVRNFGKPSNDYFEVAGRLLGAPPAEVLVIGDDWSTDVRGANEWGARSALVKSGKYAPGDEERERPWLLVDGLDELLARFPEILAP